MGLPCAAPLGSPSTIPGGPSLPGLLGGKLNRKDSVLGSPRRGDGANGESSVSFPGCKLLHRFPLPPTQPVPAAGQIELGSTSCEKQVAAKSPRGQTARVLGLTSRSPPRPSHARGRHRKPRLTRPPTCCLAARPILRSPKG